MLRSKYKAQIKIKECKVRSR